VERSGVLFVVPTTFNVNGNKGFDYLVKVKVLDIFHGYSSVA
jgi:hypothetical protein